jgi:signal transduction histidine kinase
MESHQTKTSGARSDVDPPTLAGPNAFNLDTAVAASEPVAAEAAAQVAAEAAVTAEAMVQVASEAAANAVTRATVTAEAAANAASMAAAEVVAEASAVAEAMVLAASAAAAAADRARRTVAGAISAEAAAKLAMAHTAERLSEELTRRMQTETRLLEREAELTAFAGMVAHDLKAPLRSVIGFTKMLRTDLREAVPGGVDPQTGDRIDKIINAAERMRQLIDDLLTFATARDRTLYPVAVDLQTMVTEIITERTSSNPYGSIELPGIEVGPLPRVHADPVMCRQLLDNLISNALKYTLPGQPARVRIAARNLPGDRVRVEIADRGIGIPPGKHTDVFISFHRAHPGYAGTGLGLAICQRIVDRHGGTIGVIDNPGGGSLFHFTLPVEGSMGTPEMAVASTER